MRQMDNAACFPTEREYLLTKEAKYTDEIEHPKVNYTGTVCIKPWGYEFRPYESKKIGMWCLTVKRGHATSLHCHFKKDTLLITLSGCAKIGFIDNTYQSLSVMQTLMIPKRKFHSIASFSEETTLLEIEIFSNDLTFSDKNDLLRLDDQYYRKPVGYSSSVQTITTHLEEYNYFELKPDTSLSVSGVTINMLSTETVPTPSPRTHTILIEGNVFYNGNVLKEGSLLDGFQYQLLEPITLLTLYKYDWKEDKKVIYNFEHLNLIKKRLEETSNKIIMTSGCFDVLHVGHLHTLKEARSLGDVLLVCLSSDEQIRALKGSSRPINNFEDRLNLFKTIEYVDYVFPYQEEHIETEQTLGTIMKVLDPHIWVKGTDYTVEAIKQKHPYLQNVALIPLVENKSTTNIVKKISNSLKK